MMKTFLRFGLLVYLPLLMAGCTDNEMQGGDNQRIESLQISLNAEIDQLNETRANDSGFADGDRIGLYAVARDKNGIPGDLSDGDNIGNNVGYTFTESTYQWAGDRDLYFPNEKTEVDFYSYYPFSSKIENPNDYVFSVQKNQQSDDTDNVGLTQYEKSDFLWGSAAGITSKAGRVNITFRHILSAVKVTLTKGDGFSADEWMTLDKSVIAQGTIRECHIDISNGQVSAVGTATPQPIVINNCGDAYRGIVVPQQVPAGNTLLTINVGSDSYAFSRNETMTYYPSKMHNFTIEVSKKTATGKYEYTLTSESVTPWESDPISHNGKMKEYVVVNVAMAGGLEEAINEASIDPVELINLKVTGEMGQSDFYFLRSQCKYLEALNIREVELRHCETGYFTEDHEDYTIPFEGCRDMEYLTTVVFPDKLKRIGSLAFTNTHLSGSLILPEGLEYIAGSAFEGDHSVLTGTLTLPTTLKRIGRAAFCGCDFTGELILPEGLEYIDEYAFSSCSHMTGEIHLPSSLKEVGNSAFSNMEGITGSIEYPRNQKTVNSLGLKNINSVRLPDAPTKIGFGAFWDVPIRGTLKIPESVTEIEDLAFPGTKLSHIIFPSQLEYIPVNACSWNSFLTDTVKIPSKVIAIRERAFYNCPVLDAVILPASLEKIESEAFANCTSLTYIRCDAQEPPKLADNAFASIAKDNFTVEVPEQSVNLYRQADGWKEFKRISAYKNFIARPSKYNVLNKGGELEVILNADDAWELVTEDMPSWCHIDKSSGSMKSILKLTVDRMPHGAANRSGEVTFRLKNSKETLTHINVGQYDYQYDEDECLKMQTATKGNGIDLFFVGDGYDAIDISSGTYLDDMNKEMEYFFGVEPYTTYREYFNVYTSFALSEDSGVEDVDHWRRTKFHTAVKNNDERFCSDWGGALDYCAATATEIISRPHPRVGCILLANTPLYEGITYIGESFCAVVTKSECPYPNDARGLIQHEAGGHGLGWLGDEYQYHLQHIDKCPCTCCTHSDGLRSDHSWGFSLNMSLSGKFRDVPWYHLMIHPSYSDIADIFEGGYFHRKGVFRSEVNSCMNNNVPYFSTWSRELIVKRIMEWAGEEFTMEKFYANDKRGYGKDFTRSGSGNAPDTFLPAMHGQEPVRISNYKFGKKGGKK